MTFFDTLWPQIWPDQKIIRAFFVELTAAYRKSFTACRYLSYFSGYLPPPRPCEGGSDPRDKFGVSRHNSCECWNMRVNPRLTGGGGRLTPPLPNIRDSSKTNSAIDVKLGRPSHTTIWHRPWKFFWNPSENFWDMVDFVTSLHATFGQKLAKLRGSVEGAVFNKNANEKHQKT